MLNQKMQNFGTTDPLNMIIEYDGAGREFYILTSDTYSKGEVTVSMPQ